MTQPDKIEALLAHSDWLNRLAHSLVPDPNEADEVVQEAWMRVLESPPADPSNVKGWLARIARRVVSRRQRSAIRRGDYERGSEPPKSPRAPDQLAADVALQRELTDAVLELPEVYRDAMLLRFFEDLPPRKIALRLGVPINTVRSRLARGTAALRSRLDEEHGGRRRWVLALLPLAGKAVMAETGLAMVGLGAAGAVGAAVALGGAALALHGRAQPPSAPPVMAHAAPESLAPARGGEETELASVDGVAPQRSELGAAKAAVEPKKKAAPTGIEGLVVDLDGRVAPHVRMRWQSEQAVRWQSGDRGWISGGGTTRRISAEDERKAREDPAFAGAILKGLKHKDEWRATLLDARLPGRDQSSSLGGRFAFVAGGPISPKAIEVADPNWVQIAQGERMEGDAAVEPVWVATRAHRMEGKVRGTDGSVPKSCSVKCVFAAGPLLTALAPGSSTGLAFEGRQTFSAESVNASDGEFLVRQAPVAEGAYLEVRAVGYRTRRVNIPVSLPDPFVVELDPLSEPEQWRVRGVVTDIRGDAVPGAMVAIGAVHGTAGDGGRFELILDELLPNADLLAVAAGRGATVQRDLGQKILDGSAPDELRVVLNGALNTEGSTIRGTLLGEAAEQGGWLVALDDPTMPRFSFQSIEQRAAGRTQPIRIGSGGAFAIPSVFDRAYTLRFWRPGSASIHLEPGVVAGQPITVDPTRHLRPFTATVVGKGGAGAAVSVIQRTSANFAGSGGLYDSSAPVTCDGKGRFRLPVLPASGAALSVVLAGGERYLIPVELLRGEDLELASPSAGIVEVRLESAAEGYDLFFEDASGNALPVEPIVAGRGGPTENLKTLDGRFPMAWVPLQARKAIALGPQGARTEFEIEPLPWAPVALHQP